MYGHLQERERGCKHTWLWLKLLEIGLKTPSNSLSGFCHNNNNQLTPKRPQISPKLIFRLFSTSRKSHYWSWSPLRRFCWTHSPPSERRKGLCSTSRGGRTFFPGVNRPAFPGGFLLSCESWGRETIWVRSNRWGEENSSDRITWPQFLGLCFTTGKTGPSNPLILEPQPGHIQHFCFLLK